MKCYYHSADLDGHCSGAIVKKKYPECEMIGINYGEKIDLSTIQQREEVFMVDFCLQPFSEMIELNNKSTLYWIDHHKTSVDEAYDNNFFASGCQVLDVGRAGCELTWDLLFFEPIPWAVKLLGRYDVWDHEFSDDVLPFQYGVRLLEDTRPDNIEVWNHIFTNYTTIIQNGILVLKYEQQQNKKFCRAYSNEIEWRGLNAVCANRGFTNSKLFDSVYNPEKHKLMITYQRMKLPTKVWTVSLYSTHNDVDCSAIAKEFGGGGHKGAAGFQCEQLPFNY